MPARITKKNYKKVLNIANKAHKVLNCKGVTRADFKFLKINSTYWKLTLSQA